MTTSDKPLSFFAGERALAVIRAGGFAADAVRVVAGAAGGPKWLVLSQLDRAIFGTFLAGRKAPLFLLGASIGSWRFAAVSRADPAAAITRFEEAYVEQRYASRPSPTEVSATSRGILEQVVGGEAGAREILAHPSYRLSVVTARSRGPLTREGKLSLGFGLASAAAANLLTPKTLALFFRRTLFHDPRDPAPFLRARGYGGDTVPLGPHNLTSALLASGSIPLVMAGVSGIAAAPAGVYRDGGIIDYHLNIPFLGDRTKDAGDGLVLYPHFGPRIVPGWFDKSLPWRRATAAHMSPVLLVCPSPRFLARLPGGRVPDRHDFHAYGGRDRERIQAWRSVLDACRALADDFLDATSGPGLAERVRPLP